MNQAKTSRSEIHLNPESFSEEAFYRAAVDAQKLGEEYGKYRLIETWYKIKRETEIQKLKTAIRNKDKNKKFSDVELERLAISSDDWQKTANAVLNVLEGAGITKTKYDDAVRIWQTIQSIRSSRKKEMEMNI